MEHDAKKLRGARHRGQAGEQARPAMTMRPRVPVAEVKPGGPGSAALATVIAEVLPRHDPKNPPAESAELYSDLFIEFEAIPDDHPGSRAHARHRDR